MRNFLWTDRTVRTYLTLIPDKYFFIVNDERRLDNIFQHLADLCDYPGQRTGVFSSTYDRYLWNHVFYVPGEDGVIIAVNTTQGKYMEAIWEMEKDLPGVLQANYKLDPKYLKARRD